MKRTALFASVLAMSVGPAFSQNVTVDAKLIETLQARIGALESRVRDLEASDPGETKKAPANSVETKPKTTASTPPSPAAAKSEKAPGRNYVIQEGDTVSEISRKHGIPRTAFMEANNIREGQQIYIGDTVIIPAPPGADGGAAAKSSGVAKTGSSTTGDFITYTIKYGDTLSSIAREHKVTVAAIKAANKMSSDLIDGGQKLKIPKKKSASNTAANTSGSSTTAKKEAGSPAPGKGELLRSGESYGLYTVEKGDTLFSLARDFFTSQDELQRLNEMGKNTVLRPGKDMVVPTSKYFQHHKLAEN